ncbi:metallophosphoesterase [Sorangium cellulosum]|uniref:Metallophosphoesterase n=1 Tax=Sorangium cellulosum TaxID=56 RepID=A0A2L0EL23_SORCE|nr:metallophosphoesterase [Sorangium cellulosum]AUX39990.1 metallophosphoesterase [Sorangium cellulosum]
MPGRRPLESPSISRRSFLRGAAAGAVGLGAADALLLEPRWLEVSRHDVHVAGLPRSLDGFTVAQLTDVHLTSIGGLHESLFAAVREIAPQLVVLTGDILDAESSFGALTALCDGLAGPGRKVLATLGNWEHWGRVPLDGLHEAYARGGATLLGNEHTRLPDGVVVAATDDSCSGHHDPVRALRGLPSGAPRLLLTHAPGLLDELPADAPRVDLALSGHTHGGQVRPLGFAVAVPPGSGRFVAGHYETQVGPAYVSRGIGTSVVPARFLCRPEMPVFRLCAA